MINSIQNVDPRLNQSLHSIPSESNKCFPSDACTFTDFFIRLGYN